MPDRKTLALMDQILEEVCRAMPHGGDHETRRSVANSLTDHALAGASEAELQEAARNALAEHEARQVLTRRA